MAAYTYFMMSNNNRVIYVGVTGNLLKRVYEHKSKTVKGFTERYNVCKLVHFEIFENITDAIRREKQIKAGSREKKLKLIGESNPDFADLYDRIKG